MTRWHWKKFISLKSGIWKFMIKAPAVTMSMRVSFLIHYVFSYGKVTFWPLKEIQTPFMAWQSIKGPIYNGFSYSTMGVRIPMYGFWRLHKYLNQQDMTLGNTVLTLFLSDCACYVSQACLGLCVIPSWPPIYNPFVCTSYMLVFHSCTIMLSTSKYSLSLWSLGYLSF